MRPRPIVIRASVVLLTRRNRSEFLWVKRPFEQKFLGGYWALIGGGENADDAQTSHAALACVKRELNEEFALNLSTDRFSKFGTWETPALFSMQFETTFFIAELEDQTLGQPTETMNDEAIDAEWIAPHRARALIDSGERVVSPPIKILVDQLLKDPFALDLKRDDATLSIRAYEACSGIHIFPLRTHTLPPATTTNVVLVGEQDFVIVDPGSNDRTELDRLEKFVAQRCSDGSKPVAIFLTHHHPDHILGAAKLAQSLSLPLWAHENFREVCDLPIDKTFRDGDRLPGVAQVTVWFTPGHASDHTCLYYAPTKSLVGGDLIASFGTILISPPDGEMHEYLTSLERVADANLRMLVPAHGWIVPEPTHRLNFYIQHRLKREEKVFKAVATTEPASVESILPIAYSDTPESAWLLAARSVEAHLVRLVKLGRVTLTPEGYRVSSS